MLGGNPFASALIELSERANLPLRRLLPALRRSTIERSDRFQDPTWKLSPETAPWSFPLEAGSRTEARLHSSSSSRTILLLECPCCRAPPMTNVTLPRFHVHQTYAARAASSYWTGDR